MMAAEITAKEISAGHYTFSEGEDKIVAFVNQHRYLVPVLKLVYSQLRTYFPYSQFSLQMVIDPEIPDLNQLGVLISYGGDTLEDALARLHSFDENWWLEYSDLAQGTLLIDLKHE